MTKVSMNLGNRVSCGVLTPSHIGLADRKVNSVIATALDADTVKLGGTDLQTTLTTIGQLASLANSRALTNLATSTANTADILTLLNAPYFMKAQLLTAYAGFTDLTGIETIPNMIESFAATNPHFGDWNTTTNTWACPATGFYNINASVHVTGQSNDRLQGVIVDIIIIPASGSSRSIASGGRNNGTENGSEGHSWIVTCTTLDLVLDTDKVEFKLAWLVGHHNSEVLTGVTLSPINTFVHISRR